MTNTDPTPAFRRFPWIQLVFCLACLLMAGWVWLLHAPVWKLTADDLLKLAEDGSVDDVWTGRYVRVQVDPEAEWLGGIYIEPEVRPLWAYAPFAKQVLAENPNSRDHLLLVKALADHKTFYVVFPDSHDPFASQRWRQKDIEGRMRRHGIIDYGARRFVPECIAGLVVGAMGCFIFGLYLRGWLRERKALASEPPQDMIA